jgi:hypothetical protein
MVLMAVAVVQATPPSGQHPSTPLIGILDASTLINTDRIKLQTKDATDVATFSVGRHAARSALFDALLATVRFDPTAADDSPGASPRPS